MNAKYRHRFTVLSRVLSPKAASGEQVESWPDPPAGTNQYWASFDGQTAGEVIAEGLRQTTGGLKLRIKAPGSKGLPIYTVDRVRHNVSGVVFNVTAVNASPGEVIVDVEQCSPQPALPAWAPTVTLSTPAAGTITATVIYPPNATSVLLTLFDSTMAPIANQTVTGNAGAGNVASANFTGLTDGTEYIMTGVGIGVGVGPFSGPVAAVATDPTKPSNVRVSYDEDSGDLTATWQPPTAPVSPNFDQYSVTIENTAGTAGTNLTSGTNAADASASGQFPIGVGAGFYGSSGQVTVAYSYDSGAEIESARSAPFNTPPEPCADGDPLQVSDAGSHQASIDFSGMLAGNGPAGGPNSGGWCEVWGYSDNFSHGVMSLLATTPMSLDPPFLVTVTPDSGWTFQVRGVSAAGVHGLYSSPSTPVTIA